MHYMKPQCALQVLLYLYLLITVEIAAQSSTDPSAAALSKPPAFLLGGDSTTQTKTGWGDKFLALLQHNAIGMNFGRGGRTTVNYKTDSGGMPKLLAEVAKDKGKYSVFATLQFAHNDQNQGTGITPSSFQKNLMGLASDIKSAGGIPILVTPLTRTRWKNGQFADSFVEWRAATIAAAKAGSYHYIDLNEVSTAYIKAITQGPAQKYSSDTTHLTHDGAKLFARMVADLLVKEFPAFKQYLKANAAMSEAINAGKPV